MKRILLKCAQHPRLVLVLVWLCVSATVFAQGIPITGTVKDASTGEVLPGVNVVISGTTVGVITDLNGDYKIEADANSKLTFSFVGYLNQDIDVAGRSTINVNLSPDIQALEEVVVVGYGVQKKSVVTGAISSVKASDLESMPITRIEQSLQGRTSGLTIAASSGQPGSSATVRVRGITTLNNNDPLWVVDGVVVDNGGIGYINQSDIESIEVLKDASSQAIYGARAAAGVILINTKRGKAGSLRVDYNGFFGTSAPARKLDLLDATQYATLRNESSVANGGNIIFANPEAFGKGTDWQDQIFNKSAKRQNHEISLSGGNEKSTFYTSFGYLDQEGIVASPISHYNRANIRINSTHKISKYVRFGQNLGYAHFKTKGVGGTNTEFGGPLSSAINLDPITPTIVTDPAITSSTPYTIPGAVRDRNGNLFGIYKS
jgi:TonB-linked SusC/RagA family outer membrane protein